MRESITGKRKLNHNVIDFIANKIQLPMSRYGYEVWLSDWEIIPVEYDGNLVCVFLMRGTEIHLCINKESAMKYGRRLIRVYLLNQIKKLGYLTTRSQHDSKSIIFLERLGFYKTKEDIFGFEYRIDQVKRKLLCHQ